MLLWLVGIRGKSGNMDSGVEGRFDAGVSAGDKAMQGEVIAQQDRADKKGEPVVWYVYILSLSSGKYYVGQTNDLPIRLAEHAVGDGSAVTARERFSLVWYTCVPSRQQARQMEARLQDSCKSKPEAVEELIRDFRRLMRLVKFS